MCDGRKEARSGVGSGLVVLGSTKGTSTTERSSAICCGSGRICACLTKRLTSIRGDARFNGGDSCRGLHLRRVVDWEDPKARLRRDAAFRA